MSVENFDVNRLPAQKWADEIDRFASNVRNSSAINGEGGEKLSNMDDKITFVASNICSTFEVRYGRNKFNDKHSLNATKTLMIYNPFGCIWMPYATVADILTSSLRKNLSADSHVEALADAVAAQLGTPVPKNTIPALYTGTRYQLFLNGIYDLVDDRFMEFDTDIDEHTKLYLRKNKLVPISEIGFTEKHMHNIIFDMKPDPPIFEEELEDGGDWDFREWLKKINGNDPARVEWLLYCMGLCILPCVNIGANVILRGDSGSGKSTVGTLISKMYTGSDDGYGFLYDNTVDGLVNSQHTVDTMNEDFPFRGALTPKVNFVHLSEMNGIRMSESGSTLFDKFADNDLDGKKLHAESVKLSPSPTLFMEGTKWASFDTVKNGVERRALPVALTPTKDLKHYVTMDIDKKELFENDVILTWLVRECYKTIRKVRNNKRLANIHIDLMREQVPPFVQEWRNQIVAGGGDIEAFYELMEDALIPEKPISFEMLHDIYKINCERRGMKYPKQRDSFVEAITAKLESKGYHIRHKQKRYKEPNLFNVGIDTKELEKQMELPYRLMPNIYTKNGYGRFETNDWFELVDKREL